MIDILYLLAGVLVLLLGGELLVKGAASLAIRVNIPPMLVGMTVVALGTSSPELVVSINSALADKSDIAMGNIVGSNIANVGLILGLTILIFPIIIQRSALKIDWTMMMASSILLYMFCLDGNLGRFEGLFFVFILTAFIYFSFKNSRKELVGIDEIEKLKKSRNKSIWLMLTLIIVGIFGLIYGSSWFLTGAESIALKLGVSDRIIAITLVAFGTSVPELVTSLIAAFRKQTDISIGNIIGSNLFNILAILGITAIIKDIKVSPLILSNDFIWMLLISFAILPFTYRKLRLNRIHGVLFLSSYLLFLFFLVT